jgi:hypothetical protein
MQIEKEKWVEDVLKSTDTIRQINTPDMSQSVMARIAAAKNYSIIQKNSSMIWRMAASVTLLLMINALTLYSYKARTISAIQQRQSPDATVILGFSQNSNSDPGAAIFGN